MYVYLYVCMYVCIQSQWMDRCACNLDKSARVRVCRCVRVHLRVRVRVCKCVRTRVTCVRNSSVVGPIYRYFRSTIVAIEIHYCLSGNAFIQHVVSPTQHQHTAPAHRQHSTNATPTQHKRNTNAETTQHHRRNNNTNTTQTQHQRNTNTQHQHSTTQHQHSTSARLHGGVA